MKIGALGIILFISILANGECSNLKWEQRKTPMLIENDCIWFLGIAEDESLTRALNLSDMDAKKNIFEHLTQGISINSGARLTESRDDSFISSSLSSQSDSLKVTFIEKRIHREKNGGRWIVYTDISLRKTQVEALKSDRFKMRENLSN